MMGSTDPANSAPGTIRGDLALSLAMNVIHGSDSVESAAREIPIFFSDSELLDWESSGAGWIVAED
jgi:nucleoside-diphosphate kinase